MGFKLGKMVKFSFLILIFLSVNANADFGKESISKISPVKISPNENARIYEITASFNNLILKKTAISQPKDSSFQKFASLSKKDKYAIQVLNEKGNQVLIMGIGNPFVIHADHIGYEHNHDFIGYINRDIEIAIPLTINPAHIVLLSQDSFGFKEVSRINLNQSK